MIKYFLLFFIIIFPAYAQNNNEIFFKNQINEDWVVVGRIPEDSRVNNYCVAESNYTDGSYLQFLKI